MKRANSSQPQSANHSWKSLKGFPWHHATAALLLAVHAGLAIDTERQKSTTVDEVGHLPAGISYWQQGTFELYHHNPPLVKLLAAIPAIATGPAVDYSKSWQINRRNQLPLSPWAFGWEFMYANAARYHDIFCWARLPVVLLSVLAGVVVYQWARQLFGSTAGLIGLTLWSLCPNVIAHAGMVTTDMGATSLGFVATYSFWNYLRGPTFGRAAIAGLVLGLAQLTKFSLLLLYPLWVMLWVAWRLMQRPGNKSIRDDKAAPHATAVAARPLAAEWAPLITIVASSLLVINVGYCFEGTGTALGDFQFLSRSLTRPRTGAAPTPAPGHPWAGVILTRQNRFAGTWLEGLPLPLPRHYVEGFDEQKLESEGIDGQGYPVYLRGELRRTGWWWYYIYALAIKVPLGTWLLTCVALAIALVNRSARGARTDEWVLLAPAIVTILTMSFFTDINLGLRYVLPIFPFWFVALSRVATVAADRPRWFYLAVLAPLAWNAARCFWVHPDHLAYFNESVGGPRNGYRHLIDSNLDWGQDLLRLEDWLKRNRPGERVGLAYFGNIDPSILAASGRPISFTLPPARRPTDLRLVATAPGSNLYERRNRWVIEHTLELEYWLSQQQQAGRTASPNDHPAIRALAFDQLRLADRPQPGLFAISANFVAGLPFRLRDEYGTLWHAEQDAYGYFRRLTPIAQVGYSIFVYEVTAKQAERLQD